VLSIGGGGGGAPIAYIGGSGGVGISTGGCVVQLLAKASV